jgi:outer membrane protein assembly factor BamB
MKKYLIIALPLLFLTSCTTSRVKNIVSFTDELRAEAKEVRVIIPKREPISDWDGDAHNVNIDANDLPSKIKFNKLKLSSNIAAKPIIIEDKIIVLCMDGVIAAFNIHTYSKIWTMNMQDQKRKNTTFGGGIVYNDGKLYVTNGSQVLEIINPENGRRIMTKKFPDIIIAPPLVHNNLVVLLSLGNQLFAIDKTNGSLIWDHASTPETLTYGDIPGPAIDHIGRIFVAYSSGQIFLLNPVNGTVLWQYDLSSAERMPGFLPTNVSAKPILEGDNIYLADSTGQFYKFDTKTGNIVWKKPIQDVQTINNVGNALLITTNGRQAAAIDKIDGRIIWATDIVEDIKKIKLSKLYEEKAKKIEAENITRIAEAQKDINSEYPFMRMVGKFKAKKKFVGKNRNTYDRAKFKPIDFVSSFLMNDLFTLYTAKGKIYYLSPIDGAILDMRKLKSNLDFVVISDKVVLASGKKILVSK